MSWGDTFCPVTRMLSLGTRAVFSIPRVSWQGQPGVVVTVVLRVVTGVVVVDGGVVGVGVGDTTK